MQKWEYMTWVVAYGYIYGWEGREGGVVQYKNGKLVPEWVEGPSLVDALNQAGFEGWELVTVHYPRPNFDPIYIFKREKG